MKRFLPLILALCFVSVNTASSQGLLNKVKNAVSKSVTGNQNTANANQAAAKPEPKCACDDSKLILDLSRFKIPYNEISLCFKDDGSILVLDRISGKYYIYKDGFLDGPFEPTDRRVNEFRESAYCETTSDDESNTNEKDYWMNKYPSWISKTGDKYVIRFGGKTYGPYAVINDFAVPRSGDKFAAMVADNVVATEADGKKMEEAMKNAKSDQERMELAMKFSQQMSKQMIENGGAESIALKLVTNVSGAKYDQIQWMGGKLNGSVKYDDIVVVSPSKVLDLQSRTILTFNDYSNSAGTLFLSASNTKYARYLMGSLVLSDNTTLPDLFNPFLSQAGGKTYLNYMYYSPSKNAIMQCQIPF